MSGTFAAVYRKVMLPLLLFMRIALSLLRNCHLIQPRHMQGGVGL
jgi:hypothetical protein